MEYQQNCVKTSISLAPHVMKKIDDYADEIGIGRSACIAILVDEAFRYREQTKVIAEFTASMPQLIEELNKVSGEILSDGDKK